MCKQVYVHLCVCKYIHAESCTSTLTSTHKRISQTQPFRHKPSRAIYYTTLHELTQSNDVSELIKLSRPNFSLREPALPALYSEEIFLHSLLFLLCVCLRPLCLLFFFFSFLSSISGFLSFRFLYPFPLPRLFLCLFPLPLSFFFLSLVRPPSVLCPPLPLVRPPSLGSFSFSLVLFIFYFPLL